VEATDLSSDIGTSSFFKILLLAAAFLISKTRRRSLVVRSEAKSNLSSGSAFTIL
jgi:hypothetical protein